MTNLLSYAEFMELDDEKQKHLLTEWREEYKNEDIIHALNIDNIKFYRLINDLGVEKKAGYSGRVPSSERVELDYEDLQFYYEELIPFDEFKSLIPEQQSQLLMHYKAKYGSFSRLAKAWGINPTRIYTIRNTHKTNLAKLEDESPLKSHVSGSLEDGSSMNSISTTSSIKTTYSLHGQYTPNELRNLLLSMVGLLSEGVPSYKVELSISETFSGEKEFQPHLPDDPDERQSYLLKLIEELLKTL